MIYNVAHKDAPVARLQSWDGVITLATNDNGRYQWTVGKKVTVVLKWLEDHGLTWRVSHGGFDPSPRIAMP